MISLGFVSFNSLMRIIRCQYHGIFPSPTESCHCDLQIIGRERRFRCPQILEKLWYPSFSLANSAIIWEGNRHRCCLEEVTWFYIPGCLAGFHDFVLDWDYARVQSRSYPGVSLTLFWTFSSTAKLKRDIKRATNHSWNQDSRPKSPLSLHSDHSITDYQEISTQKHQWW